jgi:BirA family transcriptional regulator, biotin operon repressor / biotin---[acetyl-CoA-carboxylase] ligase
MDTARALLAAGATPGTVVTAQTQSAGRGRQGKHWHSGVGNLHLTAIGTPVAPSVRWQLPLLTALAMVQCVKATAPDAPLKIRFPNDLYLDNKKCGGVLIEFERETPLIGIGINLIPVAPEIATIATHLPLPLPLVQENLLSTLTTCWHLWETDGFAALLPPWHEHLGDYERLFHLPDGTAMLARVMGVDSDSNVTLEDSQNTRHTLPIAALSLGL